MTELGFSTKNLTLFRDILSKSRGIVLVTGPTGAGKTTTLYSALAQLGSARKAILTVEDPVEYQIPTIRHMQICAGTGYQGRTGAFEVLVVDATINTLIRERSDAHQIRQSSVAGGMHTLLADALAKAIAGHTTIEEVIRVA